MPQGIDSIDRNKQITRLQFLFLMIIFQHDEYISVDQILHTIQTHLPDHEPSTGAIYKTLNSLTERQLIEKKIQKDDKRIKHYRITIKGAEMLRMIYTKQLQFLKFMQECCSTCGVDIQSKSE